MAIINRQLTVNISLQVPDYRLHAIEELDPVIGVVVRYLDVININLVAATIGKPIAR